MFIVNNSHTPNFFTDHENSFPKNKAIDRKELP